MDPELQQLLQSDSPASRTALYLRVLYSRRCADEVRALRAAGVTPCHAQTLAFVNSIDFERLGLEQAARLRNLAHHLALSFPCSWPVLEPALRRELVVQFIEDPAFWRFPGRALAEGFAVAAWRVLRGRELAPVADLVRLEGVLAGIVAAPTAAAPWRDISGARHEQDTGAPAGPTERFPSDWQLLNDDGELPTAADVGTLMARAPRPHRLTLTLEVDGVEISCVRLATPPEI